MEGVGECAGQCLTHAFKPAYYTNGVCYDSMAQCTAGIAAQSNWMSVTGHHRCYEYKKERGRCVPKDAKPARGCYNDPDECEAFGAPERTPERTPKTGLCLTTTADFAAAIGMAASSCQDKNYWACVKTHKSNADCKALCEDDTPAVSPSRITRWLVSPLTKSTLLSASQTA